ncbi:LOG family protein [Sphingosinicella microcystinivorans]|uniref:LOG family protein n=1 Tax=Sphingosinicella microcystinivorans TaxID=335406 RepID=UPI0022F406AA|nr:LOG family protein [Sphingosinicella microcystinivorans]WBX83710.1 LOG family protein [Sphingosinicella microcystinivorans]
MDDKTKVTHRTFPSAEEDAAVAEKSTPIPQTEHPSYRLAFQDKDFLLREELRPVRFQLELLKPEMLLKEHGIASTFVLYGSARIPSPETADALVAAARTGWEKKVAERLRAKAKYYTEAYKLAYLVSSLPREDGERHFVICSGGGPSIMEAANKGAHDAGGESVALNIVLEHEQLPNRYVTPALSFQFHYFALRKMHFLMRAKAVAAFPGGFGTLDELFETLTLIQTRKVKPFPVLLFGREFWQRIVNFEALAEEGTISRDDLSLFHFVETAEEAWQIVTGFYEISAMGGPC